MSCRLDLRRLGPTRQRRAAGAMRSHSGFTMASIIANARIGLKKLRSGSHCNYARALRCRISINQLTSGPRSNKSRVFRKPIGLLVVNRVWTCDTIIHTFEQRRVRKQIAPAVAASPSAGSEDDICGIRTHAGRPHRLSRPTP